MNKNYNYLTEQSKPQIKQLYLDGKSYREIEKLLNISSNAVKREVKGLMSRKERIDIARKKGSFIRTEETKLKLSEQAKIRIRKSNKIWTKPERMFKDILNEVGLGVKFYEDFRQVYSIEDDKNATIYFQYPLQKYVCDFVDLDHKIIYLVNGDFWHANPLLYDHNDLYKSQKNNVHHDKNRKIYLENKGFTIVDIWESEIYWNKDLVKSKIILDNKMPKDNVIVEDWSLKLKDLWFKKKIGRPKIEKIKKQCLYCNKEFQVILSKKDRIYCSAKCWAVATRKVKRPSKEELEKLILEKQFIQIGKDFGVTDNTIRKWCRQYGFDTKLYNLKQRESRKLKNTQEKICQNCGSVFKITKLCENKRKFCSHFCSEENMRKLRPKKEELIKMLETMSIKDISEKYDVLEVTVKNWIKIYNVEMFCPEINKKDVKGT
jgi:transposase/very-short-patch-repair endonuclease